jgi:hypothetical protein
MSKFVDRVRQVVFDVLAQHFTSVPESPTQGVSSSIFDTTPGNLKFPVSEANLYLDNPLRNEFRNTIQSRRKVLFDEGAQSALDKVTLLQSTVSRLSDTVETIMSPFIPGTTSLKPFIPREGIVHYGSYHLVPVAVEQTLYTSTRVFTPSNFPTDSWNNSQTSIVCNAYYYAVVRYTQGYTPISTAPGNDYYSPVRDVNSMKPSSNDFSRFAYPDRDALGSFSEPNWNTVTDDAFQGSTTPSAIRVNSGAIFEFESKDLDPNLEIVGFIWAGSDCQGYYPYVPPRNTYTVDTINHIWYVNGSIVQLGTQIVDTNPVPNDGGVDRTAFDIAVIKTVSNLTFLFGGLYGLSEDDELVGKRAILNRSELNSITINIIIGVLVALRDQLIEVSTRPYLVVKQYFTTIINIINVTINVDIYLVTKGKIEQLLGNNPDLTPEQISEILKKAKLIWNTKRTTYEQATELLNSQDDLNIPEESSGEVINTTNPNEYRVSDIDSIDLETTNQEDDILGKPGIHPDFDVLKRTQANNYSSVYSISKSVRPNGKVDVDSKMLFLGIGGGKLIEGEKKSFDTEGQYQTWKEDIVKRFTGSKEPGTSNGNLVLENGVTITP